MAGTFPTIRGGQTSVLYPVTRTISFDTAVQVATNGTEQRSKRRPPFTDFTIPYSGITTDELASIRAFFESQKGRYDSTWSIDLGTTTYSNMALLDDVFRFSERSPRLYEFTLHARQVANRGEAIPSVVSTFPTLSSGVAVQHPYTQMRRFYSLVQDMPSGPRRSWAWYSGGLSGFPTGALLGWDLEWPVLTDADLAVLENFFRGMCGRYGEFRLADPDDAVTTTLWAGFGERAFGETEFGATEYGKCRFDQDQMTVVHVAPNYNRTSLRIVQTN